MRRAQVCGPLLGSHSHMPSTDPPEKKARTWTILVGSATIVSALVAVLEFGRREPRPAQIPAPALSSNLSSKSAISAAEDVAWRTALANRKDCEAISRYVLDYPDGHFVSAAQAILAARRPITAARWASFEFPSNVVASSSLEARTSRDAACKSAQEQLLQNMADGCRDFTRDSSKYRSVVVDPPSNPRCECEDSAIRIGDSAALLDSVWRCTIRSTYRCRGEQLERTTGFTCN